MAPSPSSPTDTETARAIARLDLGGRYTRLGELFPVWPVLLGRVVSYFPPEPDYIDRLVRASVSRMEDQVQVQSRPLVAIRWALTRAIAGRLRIRVEADGGHRLWDCAWIRPFAGNPSNGRIRIERPIIGHALARLILLEVVPSEYYYEFSCST